MLLHAKMFVTNKLLVMALPVKTTRFEFQQAPVHKIHNVSFIPTIHSYNMKQ